MGLLRPENSYGEIRVTPSLSVSEQYSSNVWFVPQELVAGLTLWDMASIVSPGVTVEVPGDLMSTNISGRVAATAYVNNPDLNYVSTTAQLSLNLSPLIRRVVPRTTLSIANYFQYTPEPPAFLAPNVGSAELHPFVVGIQAFRANSLTNTASIASYSVLSPLVDYDNFYSYSLSRFGQQFVTTTGGLFQSEYHSARTGPRFKVTPLDTVGVNYTYSKVQFDALAFTTHGLLVPYTRKITPRLTATLGGGLSLIEQTETPEFLTYLANASLMWEATPNDKVSVSFSRSVVPGYALAASLLLTQTASVTAVHDFSELLKLSGSANYSKSDAPGTDPVKFTSYGSSVALTYKLSSTMNLSLSHSYGNFDYVLSGLAYAFDYHTVTLSFNASWPLTK